MKRDALRGRRRRRSGRQSTTADVMTRGTCRGCSLRRLREQSCEMPIVHSMKPRERYTLTSGANLSRCCPSCSQRVCEETPLTASSSRRCSHRSLEQQRPHLAPVLVGRYHVEPSASADHRPHQQRDGGAEQREERRGESLFTAGARVKSRARVARCVRVLVRSAAASRAGRKVHAVGPTPSTLSRSTCEVEAIIATSPATHHSPMKRRAQAGGAGRPTSLAGVRASDPACEEERGEQRAELDREDGPCSTARAVKRRALRKEPRPREAAPMASA